MVMNSGTSARLLKRIASGNKKRRGLEPETTAETSSFTTASDVAKVISELKSGKAADENMLTSEHLKSSTTGSNKSMKRLLVMATLTYLTPNFIHDRVHNVWLSAGFNMLRNVLLDELQHHFNRFCERKANLLQCILDIMHPSIPLVLQDDVTADKIESIARGLCFAIYIKRRLPLIFETEPHKVCDVVITLEPYVQGIHDHYIAALKQKQGTSISKSSMEPDLSHNIFVKNGEKDSLYMKCINTPGECNSKQDRQGEITSENTSSTKCLTPTNFEVKTMNNKMLPRTEGTKNKTQGNLRIFSDNFDQSDQQVNQLVISDNNTPDTSKSSADQTDSSRKLDVISSARSSSMGLLNLAQKPLTFDVHPTLQDTNKSEFKYKKQNSFPKSKSETALPPDEHLMDYPVGDNLDTQISEETSSGLVPRGQMSDITRSHIEHKIDYSVKKENIMILKISNFTRECPNCDIKFDVNRGTIVIKGTSKDIEIAKLKHYEILYSVKQESLQVSKNKATVMSTPKSKNLIEQKLRSEKVKAYVTVTSDCLLEAFAFSKGDAKKAIDVVQGSLVKKDIPYNESHFQFLNGSLWKPLVESLQMSRKSMVKIEVLRGQKIIIIEGWKQEVLKTVTVIQDALKDNSDGSVSAKLSGGQAKCFNKFLRDKMQDVYDTASFSFCLLTSALELYFLEISFVIYDSSILSIYKKALENDGSVFNPFRNDRQLPDFSFPRQLPDFLSPRQLPDYFSPRQLPNSSTPSQLPTFAPSRELDFSSNQHYARNRPALDLYVPRHERHNRPRRERNPERSRRPQKSLRPKQHRKPTQDEVTNPEKVQVKLVIVDVFAEETSHGEKVMSELSKKIKAEFLAFQEINNPRLKHLSKEVKKKIFDIDACKHRRVTLNLNAVCSSSQHPIHNPVHTASVLSKKQSITIKDETSDKTKYYQSITIKDETICLFFGKQSNIIKDETRKQSITIKGEASDVNSTKSSILEILLNSDVARVKERQPRQRQHQRGTKEYWRELCEIPPTPCYWKHFKKGFSVFDPLRNFFNSPRVEYEDVDRKTYSAILKLINNTWQAAVVGQGNDAKNLNHKNIRVTKIQRIENFDLYRKYSIKRIEFFQSKHRHHGNVNKFLSLEKIPISKGQIAVNKHIEQNLMLDIFPEINEQYLFHGTTDTYVENILKRGLDFRNSSEKGMLGKGTYAAESSTKADQYADDPSSRQKKDRKMLLTRMLLGNIFVAKNPQKYSKPPCQCMKGWMCKF
ncbi:hypothetical protein KUTeg_024774 [Tegillarca granosa]|uniref:Poly [ADP-ribose] polymerase n=1 Tax=Tegillarca granosa TaxID=220873 RepID=A0ABQ9E4K5_TEGGR|nr:hypothetical protein KUTeg_024774 [Tegillarca granosa]